MATQTSLPLSPIGERLQVQFSTNASWRTEGWMVFVVLFFSLFLYVNRIPGLTRDGKNWGGQIFFGGGVDQCEGQNLSRTPRFYPGSFEPVAKREDDT